jgi:hypothetical protein
LLQLLLPAIPVASSFEKPCGRYGSGSIVFAGIAGGLEKWDRTWDFPVTGEQQQQVD